MYPVALVFVVRVLFERTGRMGDMVVARLMMVGLDFRNPVEPDTGFSI